MGALPKIRELLGSISRSEKLQVLRWVMSDLGEPDHGIEKTPGVCGGDARIVRTRIAVWTLEQARRAGLSDEQILRAYPTLRAGDLAAAWAYAAAHADEIERQIIENEAA